MLGLFGQQHIDFGHILIWVPKLGKPGKKFHVKVNIDILCKYFSFLAYQGSVQLLYEKSDT